MRNIYEELSFTLKLLKKEWEEDLEQYRKKTLYTSIADKKKEGVCWYPVVIKKHKTGYGERLIIEVERNDQELPHLFQSGKSVSIFSNSGLSDSHIAQVNGVVNFVRKNIMTITLQHHELPDWANEGKLGVDLLFDEASYREMEAAINILLKGGNGRTGELRDVLLGVRPPAIRNNSSVDVSYLNSSQNKAVNMVEDAGDVAVIHGPPGTGKTTTMIAAIEQAIIYHSQIMVCAPSNAAVDLMVEKLLDRDIRTLRLGHPARVDDKMLSQTLDAKIVSHASYRELKKAKKSAEEYRNMARKYKRNFGHEERMQRKQLFEMAGRMKEEAVQLEDYITYDILQQSQVIATTLVGANHHVLRGKSFPVVFIDEAGQGLEPATWIPILKAQKVVMAGDHCQLPPTVRSFEAGQLGLKETLFEKVIERQPQLSSLLSLQYRMPEIIMGFSNQAFYKGALRSAENTKYHLLDDGEPQMIFIDTAGSGYLEHTEKDSLSTANYEEANFTMGFLENMLTGLGVENIIVKKWGVGVISPYRAQVRRFKELALETSTFPTLTQLEGQITIDTIDGFQGQERDIIVISLVRSNPKGEIGFLSDTRRMNVALTRAKRKLVVIGDSATISHHPFYQSFLKYVENHSLYKSIYEFLTF
ncbi:AAA domain-containing protein [Anditalea andensis]|uniref:DNA helicase n=1 Tax=Anditalea andensis TaxID=1048983 RepID=A0A074KZX3_9BACT|nr:AAA domain-containing protein [Anditalea andensis]KEO74484.1 DNA-binding protein [Anditalea andensis]